MNRLTFRISVVCLLEVPAVVGFPGPCFACSCVAETTPAGGWTRDTLLAGYDLVFLGRVVDVGPLRDFGGGATDGGKRP